MSDGIPIRLLSEITGVAATTLRAWERRYHLLAPQRTSKGHRLYGDKDVQRVKAVVELLQEGLSISQAVERLNSAQHDKSQIKQGNPWPVFQRRMLQAIEHFDENRLEACYSEVLSLYPFGLVTRSLIQPILSLLGERWQQRPCGIAEEHFFTAYLRNKLGAQLQREVQRKHGNLLLVACLPGESHELGLLLFAIEALSHGYRMIYLGANTPLPELPQVAEKAGAKGILLSGTATSHSLVASQWSALHECKLPVLVGGAFSEAHQSWLERQQAIPLSSHSLPAISRLLQVVPPYSRSRS